MMKNILPWALLPIILSSTHAFADTDPLAVLKAASTKLQAAHSFSAELNVRREYPPKAGQTERRRMYELTTIECSRPNLARDRTWFGRKEGLKPDGTPPFETLSSGSKNYIIDGGEYETQPLTKDGRNASDDADTLTGFFNVDNTPAARVADLRKQGEIKFIRIDPAEQWQGATYTVVEYEYVDDGLTGDLSADEKAKLPGGQVISNEKVYIGNDGLIHRILDHESLDWDQDYSLTNIKVDPAIAVAEFVLPKEFKPAPPPQPLLADDSEVPDFTVLDAKGKGTSFADYRGKVLIIDFWATWCGPCQESMPGLQKLAAKYGKKGVVTLAINVWDTKPEFEKWIPAHPEYSAFTILRDPTAAHNLDVASRLFHVSGIPSQFVVDKNGKIVASFVGYNADEGDLERAIKLAL
jgi:thiol-disulfide isomerase/thioredoxin